MTSQLILALFAQVLLTLIVMVIMGRRRFGAAKKKQIQMRQFATMELGSAPESVQVAGRNFINQFEIPVLFYVAVLCALATNNSGYAFVALAWLFVLTRVIHSVIHLSTNHLRSRYFTFLAGCVVVLAMWLTLVWRFI
ncbi:MULTISPECIES: MAPEG family protein [unclassified Pseudoalteromonas]|uniref:MAPEG family protein n=1 Tax=unclassified Pseudoalteromonas TaxID=194690 RepID=UPI000CF7085B|nr:MULTISPECIES: MAPEG family protein [unclassified Pseudoalteromonas]